MTFPNSSNSVGLAASPFEGQSPFSHRVAPLAALTALSFSERSRNPSDESRSMKIRTDRSKPMNRFSTCVVIALSFQFAATGKAVEQSGKPNVLMICIDDLNDWVGFLGGHLQANTPHMGSLAKRGRIFANAHCAVPVCSASRASVMSGVAATTHGSYELGPRYEQLPALTNVPRFSVTSKTMVITHCQAVKCCTTVSEED